MNDNLSPIVKFTEFFIKKWRLSVLLLVGVILLGTFSYTSVLKRESMPTIELPIGVVMVPYFVNDQNQVNQLITIPLESTIGKLAEVDKISSESTENISSLTIFFNKNVSAEEGMNIVKTSIAGDLLPSGVKANYIQIDASKIDGVHDMLFAVTGEGKTIKELEIKANEISEELKLSSSVGNAETIDVIKNEVNPLTKQTIEYQDIISRFGKRENGKMVFQDAVYIGVNKKNESIGTIALSDAVKNVVQQMQKQEKLFGYDVNFSLGDQSVMLIEQIESLQKNAIEATIIVLIVIFVIVNWRAAFISVIFIIATLTATALAFSFIGYTINTMTLFALVLVLGLFVDDAIVVVEAIDAQKQAGLKGLAAVRRAVHKVGVADLIGTSTTMLVFVPMIFISGVMGDFIRIMPVTVILALGISLLIALSVIPFLSHRFLSDKTETKKKGFGKTINKILYSPGIGMTKLGDKFSKIVDSYLKSPVLTITVIFISLILIVIGIYFAAITPFSIFPPAKDGDAITIQYQLKEGTTIEDALEQVKKIETVILDSSQEFKMIDYFGTDEKGGLIYAELSKMSERSIKSNEIVDQLNEGFIKLPDIKAKASQPSAGPSSSEYAFQLQIYDEDSQKLTSASSQIKSYLLSLELDNDVKVEDVVFTNLISISKNDERRYAQVKAKITDNNNQSGYLQDLTKIVKDHYTEDELSKIGLSKNSMEFDLGMETEMMGSFNSTLIGLLIAMVVMYGILVVQFNSYSQPLLVFLGIPFSFILLFPGLHFTGHPMSFFVLIGITALTGILANNIIMLLDFARMRVEEESKNPREAIVGALKRRFRPLVATSVTTISGLLPLAISDPFWAPLALTIIFGLIASTTMVITVLPAYYLVLENSKFWIKKKLGLRR